MNRPSTKLYSAAQIEAWLRQKIAEMLGASAGKIEPSSSLEDLALDSLSVVRIAGELDDLLGLELEPSLLYEYESLAKLCSHLEAMHRREMLRRRDAGSVLVIRIAASFTAEPVEESVAYAFKKLRFSPQIVFAPYNQVFQELLNPASLLARNQDGVNLLLVRVEDWFRFEQGPLSDAAFHKAMGEFQSALRRYSESDRGKLIVALCPHTSARVRKLHLSEALDEADEAILALAGELHNVHPLDLRDLGSIYSIRRVFDEARDELGHIPFTPELFAAMGMHLVRKAFNLLHPPLKVIVLDCDNTLWKGVCGEDGPCGVNVTPPLAAFQALLTRRQEEGLLLCLCSKNNEADAWEVFARNPGMKLKRSQFVAARLNWTPKSENIRSLAKELNIGAESCIFIDDNPAECAEVRGALPEVIVIQMPEEPQSIPAYFNHHWAFDASKVTQEDRRRTEMMLQNRQREMLRSQITSFEEFIKQLQVVVQIEPLQPHDLARASQLTVRTNQFNATAWRRSEAEIQAFAARKDRRVFTVRVKDCFGDYGLVGLMAVRAEPGVLACESFMMSCRVLGKRVEHEMIRQLARTADEWGLSSVQLQFIPTEKNRPVRDFFESLGRPFENSGENLLLIAVSKNETETLLAGANVEHRIEETPEALNPVSQPGDSISLSANADALHDFARFQGNVDALMREIRSAAKVKRGNPKTEYAAPRSAWEKNLATIWSDVLGVERVGIYDGFFDLGGDSLRAAEAFTRMADLGVPESISLVNATIASVARAIEDVKAGRTPQLVHDQFSLKDEGAIAEDIRHEGYDVLQYDNPMRNVFLTGGTGYLGAFFISELMLQTEVAVRCLVRASTPGEGRRRIVSNLSRYRLWSDAYHARIEIVLGELSEPLLGLEDEAFRKLAHEIDTIFHSGAWVNFVFPYSRLRSSHVDAMENILRLAVSAKPKPIAVHFVSTLGVIMSTGYAPGVTVPEDQPLEHVEGLLNGYEQAKHVADKMAWRGRTERGIPTAIYRPAMVGGHGVTGEYHKLDEFLASAYRGSIQLGAMPLLDTTWEVIPVDFLTKVIVHGAKDPRNLNKVYHSLHPEATPLANYIEWFRELGYPMRALPFEVWKRELLSQGSDKLKLNALFPFVDFIRALYKEQVCFPPTDKTNFLKLMRDSGFECPDQKTVFRRYLDYFRRTGHIPEPWQESSATPSIPPSDPSFDSTQCPMSPPVSSRIDNRAMFNTNIVGFSEAYYVLWTDITQNLSMVVRYVLFNGPTLESKIGEVWCWFHDRTNGVDLAVRQRYPLFATRISPDAFDLRIGNASGIRDGCAWGRVVTEGADVSWTFDMLAEGAIGLDRVPGMEKYSLLPRFYSPGCKQTLNARITANGRQYCVTGVAASDGHYWNTNNLQSWSWANAVQFKEDPAAMLETIAIRLCREDAPIVTLAALHRNGVTLATDLPEAIYRNRELESQLEKWRISSQFDGLEIEAEVTGDPDDMILILHPLPNGGFLYTTITLTANARVDIYEVQYGERRLVQTLTAEKTAAFEVTKSIRNERVTREFAIVPATAALI